ncbi:MAG: polysaccharide export protein [Sphingobacteriia bacterium]|jgi:polysaccharide biosynthesis/export protein|nr:polysaccharide export protein [Sphingobacteriia bacterium]
MAKKVIFSFLTALVLLSCASNKKIPYFKGISEKDSLINTAIQYETRICSGDMLTIVVSGLEPLAVAPFNLPIITYNSPGSEQLYTTPTFQPYLVDINGEITFPVLGKIKLAGLKKSEAINLIQNKLVQYLKDPIVTIQFLNYKVTVLGEVGRPGSYTITNERVSILEALGLAGDMTVYGKRDNVLLIRENNGKKEFIRLDLNSTTPLSSPYYYLQQNDVIYVEPNSTKLRSAASLNVSLWLTAVSTLASMVTVIVALINIK